MGGVHGLQPPAFLYKSDTLFKENILQDLSFHEVILLGILKALVGLQPVQFEDNWILTPLQNGCDNLIP